jgi:hypothetical protein
LSQLSQRIIFLFHARHALFHLQQPFLWGHARDYCSSACEIIQLIYIKATQFHTDISGMCSGIGTL